MALDPPMIRDGDRRGWLRVALAHAAVATRRKFATGLGMFGIGRIAWDRRKPVRIGTLGIKLRILRRIPLAHGLWGGRARKQRS